MSEPNTAREEWLTRATNEIIEKVYGPHELRTPPILTVAAGLLPGKALGCCTNPEMSDENAVHIWVTPEYGTGQEMEILGTLTHELVHASLFSEGHMDHGHGHLFKNVMKQVGLQGKPKSATAHEGTELWTTLEGIAAGLGQYPHRPLRKKPVKTRQSEILAYVSETDAEFEVKIKFSIAYENGAPRDFNGQPMVPKDKDKWAELEEAYLNKPDEDEEAESAEAEAAE